jgi:hypothetical protein
MHEQAMTDDDIPSRYHQNPLLALIENYILDTLGLLEPDKVPRLAEIVTKTFGGTDWRKTLRDQFHLPPDTDETLKQLWQQRLAQAELEQTDAPSPISFAMEQADSLFQNLGH